MFCYLASMPVDGSGEVVDDGDDAVVVVLVLKR